MYENSTVAFQIVVDTREQEPYAFACPTVRRKLERYLDVAEITQLNCTFQMGGIAADVAERSMELFAREVMPHFRER